MIVLRSSSQRGYADHGWLKTYHSFSFANYFDPQHMGFGNLRVLNEDQVAPGTGFGMHGHEDMEIITLVLQGVLTHQDDMGHSVRIVPGDIQRMTAGRGIQHSEFNHEAHTWVHLFQIWLEPQQRGLDPSYAQQKWALDAQASPTAQVRLLAAPVGEDPQAVPLHADARIHWCEVPPGQTCTLPLDVERLHYVHLIDGAVAVNGFDLQAGDAAKIVAEPALQISTTAQAGRLLVFDLASMRR